VRSGRRRAVRKGFLRLSKRDRKLEWRTGTSMVLRPEVVEVVVEVSPPVRLAPPQK
jgi:hypothetical protein